TTLLRRFATGMFQESRIMTIGVDFQTVAVKSGDLSFKLTVWDLAGQERFASFRENFYLGARAVAMVYGVTDRPSFDDLSRWLQEAKAVVDHNRFLVVGNKIDVPNRAVEMAEGKQYAASISAAYLETSAKTGDGVARLFELLARAAHTQR
ncbi:MAG: GTP-binding protein, partial [Chloroflexi bacterium]|nr:GTP-binding protein [Chloroflexota bacterium]